MKRVNQFTKLDNQFIKRWSPRSFKFDPLSLEEIQTVFEAARWAPSCFNDQPWHFVVAHEEEALIKMREAMMEGNQVWANKAPVLIGVFARKHMKHDNSVNKWAGFDAGAAWMSIALQAHQMGLITHAMGGFFPEKLSEICKLDPELYEPMCMVAMGKQGALEDLPENFHDREEPSDRVELQEILQFLKD